MREEQKIFSEEVSVKVELNYILNIPNGYESNSTEKWPLIMFLHGMGERGRDINLVKRHGIPKYTEEHKDFPFISVSPQCPKNTVWDRETHSLHALLKYIIKNYNVDTSRIYLTGLSMGGFGTWHLAEAYPKFFAAILPICGGAIENIGFTERIKVLKDLPIWVFHGKNDRAVPVKCSEELVNALIEVDGNIKFTVYEDGYHDVWTRTYNNEELYTWLLNQKNEDFKLD